MENAMFGIVVCALGIVACDPTPEAAENHAWIVEGVVDADTPANFKNPVIATIDTDMEGMIEFLDESLISGSGIGIVATGEEGKRAIHLLDAEGASPLEIFLALTPADAKPPKALFLDHGQLAAAGEVPEVPRALVSLRDDPLFDTFCEGPPDEISGFNWFWNSFASGYDSVDNDTSFSTLINFTITTGVSTKRALAVCKHTDDEGKATMNLYKQNPSTLVYSMFYHHGNVCRRCGVAYRSSTPLVSTRYREQVISGGYEDYYVGRAYGN